ncbi:MAG: phytoene/squalene synthase family protein [Verrucomicrobiae bacterium]|nr:phytoene/squalene synthase family protein [Verrucomicrobiae bacterium]
MSETAASFRYCRALTRRTARNFWFSFLTLPRPKRDAMCAVYAWMRRLDDLADDAPSPQTARNALENWRAQTHAALAAAGMKFQVAKLLRAAPSAASPPNPEDAAIWPAFSRVVRSHNIPPSHFDEIVEGALMDQEVSRYASFDDLYRYCFRVASVVGLVCLRVFGYERSDAEQPGEWLGIAFQLTNILRDVREDAARGRIYLPLDALARHGVSESDVLEGRWSPGFHALLREFGERAEEYYVKAQPLFALVRPDARPTLRIMEEIYHGILDRIRAIDYRVLDARARLAAPRKLWIVAKHALFRPCFR